MKIIYAALFGLIYTTVYFFLAIMSTGGGHGNFFLLAPLLPLWTWLPILIALFLLTRLKTFRTRVFFVVLMLAHYGIVVFNLLGGQDLIVKDWNRGTGREGIYITIGFYLLGQTAMWLFFLKSIRKQEPLK